jgi:hypothetical protein
MVEEGVRVMWRSGPWDAGMLDRLRFEVESYFRAYYAELRRLVAEHDDRADIPEWFRGGRQIETDACTDGVVIAHTPYHPESRTYSAREDTYRFRLAVEHGNSVGEKLGEWYSPEFPDGSKLEVMPEYSPGEDFGIFVRLWPAHMFSHYLPDGR